MTAKEANKLATDSLHGPYFDYAMQDVYASIKRHACKGYKYVHRYTVDKRISDRVIAELTLKGYEVIKRTDHYDSDNDSINIQWFDR